MRLLLVEDDPMIGESLEEGLRGERYAVDWARDGRSAELRAVGGESWDGSEIGGRESPSTSTP